MKEIIMYNTAVLAQKTSATIKPNTAPWMQLKNIADKFNAGEQKILDDENPKSTYSVYKNLNKK